MKINRLLKLFNEFLNNNKNDNKKIKTSILKNYDFFINNHDKIEHFNGDIEWIKRHVLSIYEKDFLFFQELYECTRAAKSTYIWIYDYHIINKNKLKNNIYNELVYFQIKENFKKNYNIENIKLNYNSFFFNQTFEKFLNLNKDFESCYLYFKAHRILVDVKNKLEKEFKNIEYFDKSYEQDNKKSFFLKECETQFLKLSYNEKDILEFLLQNQSVFSKKSIDLISLELDNLNILNSLDNINQSTKNIKKI